MKNPIIQTMERSLRLCLAGVSSSKTKKDYEKNLRRFQAHVNFKSFDEYAKKDPKLIQEDVEDYILSMAEDTHPNSIPTFYYPIQTFLEMNDIIINFKKMRRLFPEKVKTAVERGWTTEEIRTMLEVSDTLKTIAIIHFESASGGRLGLFEGLLMKHLQEINDEKHGKCYAIVGYAESKEQYTTFLTPEATKALDRYLDSRKNEGEIFTKETPVFIDKNNNISTPKSLGKRVYYSQLKAGLRNPSEKKRSRFAVPSNHGFRHRFNEVVKSSNVINPHVAERLLSHTSKIIPLDTIYFKPDIDTLFLEYKKIIPLISITDLEQERAESNAIRVERSEHEKVKAELAEVKARLSRREHILNSRPDLQVRQTLDEED